ELRHRPAASALDRAPHEPRVHRDEARDPESHLLGDAEAAGTARRGGVRRATQIVLPVALTAAVFGIWDLVVNVFTIQSYVLPRPYAVFAQIGTDWDVLQPAMWQTIEEFVIGFFVGIACGFVLAVAMGESRILKRGLYPLLIASQAIPIIAIGAALVIWLGFG